jgi:hypothetical protein
MVVPGSLAGRIYGRIYGRTTNCRNGINDYIIKRFHEIVFNEYCPFMNKETKIAATIVACLLRYPQNPVCLSFEVYLRVSQDA